MLTKIITRNLLWLGLWILVLSSEVTYFFFGATLREIFELPAWPIGLFPLFAIASLVLWSKVIFGEYPKWNEFFWVGQCLMIGVMTFLFAEATWGMWLAIPAASASFLVCFGILINSRAE